MAVDREGLLGKVYYENCPGCKQNRKKELQEGVPYKEFFYIWIVTLCSSLPICSLYPFLYFMVRDMQIAETEEDISFYAGFIGAAFMCGRASTSVLWGMIADRYGRRPVIMVSIISVVILNALFGLSTTFWMAMTTRLLLGFLCGLLGPIKAYATEVCQKEHHALGLSLVSTSRSIGLIIGPAFGGLLSQPADKYPRIFPKESLFGRFPYFLPCLCISVFAVGAFIACLWLPETLHFHSDNSIGDDGTEARQVSESGVVLMENSEGNDRQLNSEKSLFKNWPLISSMIIYCIFSFNDAAYSELFSLWAESNLRVGGLSFSSDDVGEVLAVSGFGLLLFQLFLYPRLERALGPVFSSRVAAIISIPVLASYPFISKLPSSLIILTINFASLFRNILSVIIITALNILQNNAVPQHQRGVANGISVTAMSIFKAIAPAVGGALLSWAEKRTQASFLPGAHMVFFMMNVSCFAGLLLTFKPFLTLPVKSL